MQNDAGSSFQNSEDGRFFAGNSAIPGNFFREKFSIPRLTIPPRRCMRTEVRFSGPPPPAGRGIPTGSVPVENGERTCRRLCNRSVRPAGRAPLPRPLPVLPFADGVRPFRAPFARAAEGKKKALSPEGKRTRFPQKPERNPEEPPGFPREGPRKRCAAGKGMHAFSRKRPGAKAGGMPFSAGGPKGR